MLSTQNKSDVATGSNFDLSEAQKHKLIKQYESYPTSSGRTQYLRFLRGEKLTYREGILAKCAECNCGYVDGQYDCGVLTCPLHQFMPYHGKYANYA